MQYLIVRFERRDLLKKRAGNEIIFQLFERTFEHLEIRLQK